MSVRVRMAPSPTGFLHVGVARTFIFNWLFARQQEGECLLRIENTDMNREVEGATEQIQRSLAWLGGDWDALSFQLERQARCEAEAQRLVEAGHAYEDEGAIRFRMPDDGVTAWDDLVLGRVEVPNRELEDVVLVRSDGRPTYNFASPIEDWHDESTHVVRGRDHISNTPKQITILRALGAEPPAYAHMPDVLGDDGKKLSKRHGAQSLDEFRDMGYYAPALMNFLALLGWSYDDKTTIMSRDELIGRFSFVRSPPTNTRTRSSSTSGRTGTKRRCGESRHSCRKSWRGWASSRSTRTSTSRTTSSRKIPRCSIPPFSSARAKRSPRSTAGRRSRSRQRYGSLRSTWV